MASSDFLRQNKNQHVVKNIRSKKMDKDIDLAVECVLTWLRKEYPSVTFYHTRTVPLSAVIKELQEEFPQYRYRFAIVGEKSFIKPDGGFIYFKDTRRKKPRFVLIPEVKRQGTNDKRLLEGLPKQARGNAIERLGKNLVGIKALMHKEGILPFVVFGSGDDFTEKSSIVDRVITMNEFFPLNRIFVRKVFLPFEPVSMFFRYEEWTVDEMCKIMQKVAMEAMKYYGY